jgi:hypothetical protein
MNKAYNRTLLFSIPELKTRGWTDTAIKRFLPEPDDTRPNPRYSQAGAPMQFWLKSRVYRVEKTKRFLAWRAGSETRKAAAQKAIGTRISRMEEAMESVEVTIQRGWTDEQIRELAVRTHGGNFMGDPGEFHWCNQTARNCIRHNLTNYEQLWKKINRGETGEAAYQILRERVDELVDEAYAQYREADESD